MLLWRINYLEHFTQIDLILFKDIRAPIEWVVRKILANDIQSAVMYFSNSDGFFFTSRFLRRFDCVEESWKPSKDAHQIV